MQKYYSRLWKGRVILQEQITRIKLKSQPDSLEYDCNGMMMMQLLLRSMNGDVLMNLEVIEGL